MTENYLNIPDKIIVGIRNTQGFVTYKRNDGKIAKEVSWKDWVGDSPVKYFENSPTKGFKLEDCVGGKGGSWYSYSRQAYAVIKDPRGFIVEITFDNLIWLMEHYTHDVKEGFIGELVYGWDGKELMLVPVDSKDYKYTRTVQETEKIKLKDCIPGCVYKFADENYKMIYLGYLPSICIKESKRGYKYKNREFVHKKYHVFKYIKTYIDYNQISSTKKEIIYVDDSYKNNVENLIKEYYRYKFDNSETPMFFKNIVKILPDMRGLTRDLSRFEKDIEQPYMEKKSSYGSLITNLDRDNLNDYAGTDYYWMMLFNEDYTKAEQFWITRKLMYDGLEEDKYIYKKEREWINANRKFFDFDRKSAKEEFKKLAKREVFVYRGDVYSIKENMIVKDDLAYETISYNSRRDINYTEFKAKDFLEKHKDSNLYLTKRSKSTENKLKAVTDNNYEFKFDEYY